MFLLCLNQPSSYQEVDLTSSTLVHQCGALIGAQYIQTTVPVSNVRYTQYDMLISFLDYSYKQYLAVAPFPSRTHSPLIGTRTQKPAPSCIQLWALHPSQDVMDVDSGVLGGETSRKNAENMSQGDCGEMACEMVLCIDSGAAFELKWCPLPSNDTHQVHVKTQ